jgi:hypothetical protein
MEAKTVTRVAPVRDAIGAAFLAWLGNEPGQETRLTNKVIAGKLDLPLMGERGQNRRLNEALAALRDSGAITVSYETPHPRLSPAGRVISLVVKEVAS